MKNSSESLVTNEGKSSSELDAECPIAYNRANFRTRLSALSLETKPDFSIDRKSIHDKDIEAECVEECCKLI